MTNQIMFEMILKEVKRGVCTAQEAEDYLQARDIYLGRGHRRTLLRAEATAILRADHLYMTTA